VIAMTEITNELMFEVLKTIQSRLTNIETGIREIRSELVAIRGHLVATQQDVANLYSGQAGIELRLEHIERRLDIAEAPVR
jgi:chromosome segregation ATPase